MFHIKPLAKAIQNTLLISTLSISIFSAAHVCANEITTAQQYNISAGALDQVLTRYAAQAGISLAFDHATVSRLNSNGLQGQFSVEDGLNKILASQPYQAQKTATGYILVVKPKSQVRDMGQLSTIDIATNGKRGNTVTSDANALLQLPVITVSAERNGSAEEGYLVKNITGLGIWGERSLQDTPYSMTVISEDLISNAIAGDMDQLYKMNPTIQNSTPMAVDGYPIAIFRGFENDIGIIDGLRLSSNSRGIAMEELERVEIINGLTGFIYGVSSGEGIGGTTNYVLKRPTYHALQNLTVGNYGHQQWFAHLDLGNKIDEKGKFAYRLNLSHQDGETGKENQNVERTLMSGALDWNATDDLQLQLEAAYTHYRIDKLDSRFYAYKNNSYGSLGYWIKPLENNKTYTPDWTYNETKTHRVGLNATWNINEIYTFRSAYMYKKDEDKSRYMFPIYFEDSGWVSGWTNQKAPSWNVAQGAYAYLDSEFNTANIKHKLTFGVSGDILDVEQYENGYLSGGNSPVYDHASDLDNWAKPEVFNNHWDYGKKYKASKSKNSNITIGDDITFNENWSALIGLNYTTVNTKNFTSSGDTESKYDKSELTPTVSFIFKPFENLTTYVTYMEGLSKGETVPDDPEYNNSGQILDPYLSYQYEVGAKYSIHDDLLLSSSLFRIEKANAYEERTSDGKITLNQDGLQIHQGLELTAMGKITDHLTLMAGGTLMDVKVDKTDNPLLKNKEPIGVSSLLAKLYTEYNIPMLEGLTFTAGVYHSGSKYQDALNKNKIDAYTIYDAGLRYKTKIDKFPTTLNLNVANLTNKNYWATTWQLGIPRTVAFSMKTQF